MARAELVLDAPGYQTRRRSFPIPTALRLSMLPDVEANVTLRLRHENGSPYTGPLEVTCGRRLQLDWTTAEPGTIRVGLPARLMRIQVAIPDSPLEARATLDLPATRPLHREIPVEASGSLSVTLHRGGGALQSYVLLVRRFEAGNPAMLLSRADRCRVEIEPGRELLLGPLPPGSYQVRFSRHRHRPWSTTVEVRAGERASIVAPPLQRSE
jgi:hypothetical protein